MDDKEVSATGIGVHVRCAHGRDWHIFVRCGFRGETPNANGTCWHRAFENVEVVATHTCVGVRVAFIAVLVYQ